MPSVCVTMVLEMDAPKLVEQDVIESVHSHHQHLRPSNNVHNYGRR